MQTVSKRNKFVLIDSQKKEKIIFSSFQTKFSVSHRDQYSSNKKLLSRRPKWVENHHVKPVQSKDPIFNTKSFEKYEKISKELKQKIKPEFELFRPSRQNCR